MTFWMNDKHQNFLIAVPRAFGMLEKLHEGHPNMIRFEIHLFKQEAPIHEQCALFHDVSGVLVPVTEESEIQRHVRNGTTMFRICRKVSSAILFRVVQLEESTPFEFSGDIEVLKNALRSILRALEFIHEKRIIFRELNPEAIRVTPDGSVKLSFNFSERSSNFTDLSYSQLVMSPERIEGFEYGSPSDIWELGMTLVILLGNNRPWHDDTHEDNSPFAILERIAGNEFPLPTLPDKFPVELQTLVSECLNRDPTKRPSATKLREHSFLV